MALKEQMELFEDGGLKDEGNTIDPISGNDVPPGSTQEEVRDDIPAQLSEGEFVFPADVVRYIGLEKLMQMRQQAKMGLQTMDDMGQMGNNDEAIIPDTIPFELSDLDMEDDLVEMQQGGLLDPKSPSVGIDPIKEPDEEKEKSGLLDPVKSKVDSNILTRDVEQDDISNLPMTYTPATQQDVPMQPDYSGLTYKDVMPEITPSYFKTGERSYRPATSTATPETVTPTVSTPSEPALTIEEQDILYEPPAPAAPPTTPSGLTPDDPESPFNLENTSGYKGDTVQEQQTTSDEQMADLFEGPTQAEQDAQELINIDPVRDEVFNQFNNLGEVDKSKIYDAYGIDQGNFESLLNKAGTNFIKQFTTSVVGGMVGGIPGLLTGSQVGKLFEDKDEDTPKDPVLTGTQTVNRERAAMALGIEMTGEVGHGKGDIDPVTGYVYNRYGVPINPSTGDALNKIKFADLDSLSKSLQANGKSGWRGGYIGTKDSNRYKNLNDIQKANYDKYVTELDKIYGFTDEPATYATTQQVAGRPLKIDDEDAGGKTPSPEFTTPATYDQIMQELMDEDADITDNTGVDIFGNVVVSAKSNVGRPEDVASDQALANMYEGVGEVDKDMYDEALFQATQADISKAIQEEKALEREQEKKQEDARLAAIAEANKIKDLEAKRKADAKRKAEAAALAAEVARMKRLEEQRIAKEKKQDKKEEKKRKELEDRYDSFDNAKGGLIPKKKPKPKKMRSGGLASR
jgi:hypothetical protein